jgi:hypothetical protein
MFLPFFALAARSPTRQATFRRAVLLHLALLGGGVFALTRQPPRDGPVLLGHLLLVAGIIEGAGLVGWRLTQMPKSQALEFLLVSPLRPRRLFLGEACVGLALLGLVTLSGLPVLALLAADGRLDVLDPLPLLVMPFTWGAVTGLRLAAWAYEPAFVRRRGERVVMGLVLLYLLVGVVAGENLRRWVDVLPPDLATAFLQAFRGLHTHNPFGVVQHGCRVPSKKPGSGRRPWKRSGRSWSWASSCGPPAGCRATSTNYITSRPPTSGPGAARK